MKAKDLIYREYKAETLLFCLLIIIFAINLPPYLYYPYVSQDHGFYSFAASQMMKGIIPYRDYNANNWPGIIMIHALAIKLFGHSMANIRIFDSIYLVLVLLMIYRVSFQVFNNQWISFLACIFYEIRYFSMGFWDTAQKEEFQLLFLLLALYFFLKPTKGGKEKHCLILSGFFTGVALLFKHIALILYAFWILYIFSLVVFRKISIPTGLKRSFYLSLGFLVPCLAFFLFLIIIGALTNFYRMVIYWNHAVLYPKTFSFQPIEMWESFRWWVLTDRYRFPWSNAYSIYGLITILLVWLKSLRTNEYLKAYPIFLLFALYSLLHLILQRYDYYKYIPMYCAFSISMVYLMVKGLEWLKIYLLGTEKAKNLVQATIIILSFTYFLICSKTTFQHYKMLPSISGSSPGDYYSFLRQDFPTYPWYQKYDINTLLKVGSYIREHSQSEDTAMVWSGAETMTIYFAQRNMPTWFWGTEVLLTRLNKNNRYFSLWRRQFMEELQRNKPLFFIIAEHTVDVWPMNGWLDLQDYPELMDFLKNNYKFATKINTHTIFRRQG